MSWPGKTILTSWEGKLNESSTKKKKKEAHRVIRKNGFFYSQKLNMLVKRDDEILKTIY